MASDALNLNRWRGSALDWGQMFRIDVAKHPEHFTGFPLGELLVRCEVERGKRLILSTRMAIGAPHAERARESSHKPDQFRDRNGVGEYLQVLDFGRGPLG
jgi:hypothetical protein